MNLISAFVQKFLFSISSLYLLFSLYMFLSWNVYILCNKNKYSKNVSFIEFKINCKFYLNSSFLLLAFHMWKLTRKKKKREKKKKKKGTKNVFKICPTLKIFWDSILATSFKYIYHALVWSRKPVSSYCWKTLIIFALIPAGSSSPSLLWPQLRPGR